MREEACHHREDHHTERGAQPSPHAVAADGRGRLAAQVPEVHDEHQRAAARAQDHIGQAALRVELERVRDPGQQQQAARGLDVCGASAPTGARTDSERGCTARCGRRATRMHARRALGTRTVPAKRSSQMDSVKVAARHSSWMLASTRTALDVGVMAAAARGRATRERASRPAGRRPKFVVLRCLGDQKKREQTHVTVGQ